MAAPRRVSQTQIAKDLGISQALVSLALNGRKQGINLATYQRIWDHAIKLGYTPKGMQIESVVATQRSQQVGYILRSPLRLYTQSNFFSHVQHGLYTSLEAAGCRATFLGTEDELSPEKLEQLLHPGDGMLGLVLFGEVKRPFLEELRKRTNRIVAISASFPGVCSSITSNEHQAVELLVSHLVELGHQRFCWFGGNLGMGRHSQRRKSLENVMQLHDLVIPEELWIDEANADRLEGAACAQRLLATTLRSDLPTAVICYNGMMARGAVNHFHKEGVRIPEEISVVAIDQTRVITEENPTITGASAIPEKMGENAARLLLENSNSEIEGFMDYVLPAEIRARESSSPPRKKGAGVLAPGSLKAR